ncbi:MAG TPA: hypothetical protein VHB72_04270 [Candidatus Saccharimonadales bacterium]|nr:hypothetical protein [Candidatus Saccharimonadales bacterium]
MSEIVEQNALRLKITDAEESGSLRDEMSYETAMRGIQDRARTLCSMGDKCCLNVVTTDFIPNESAVVVVGCDNRECPSPRVVEETALNRVPDQGQSVEVAPLLTIS